MNPKLKMLCELYDRSDENIDIDVLLKVCFFKNLEEVLKLLSNKQQVIKFAYLCAKSVFHLNNEKTKDKAEKCLELVEKWLENPDNVSHDELRNAHSAAYNTTYDADYSAYIAAYDVACSSYYAYDAATYVAFAIYAAANASYAAENKREQEYKNLGFLVKVIRDEL